MLFRSVTPVPPPGPERLPLLDLEAGYVRRSLGALPQQGARSPWRLMQSYRQDVRLLVKGDLEDDGVRFERRSTVAGGVSR